MTYRPKKIVAILCGALSFCLIGCKNEKTEPSINFCAPQYVENIITNSSLLDIQMKLVNDGWLYVQEGKEFYFSKNQNDLDKIKRYFNSEDWSIFVGMNPFIYLSYSDNNTVVFDVYQVVSDGATLQKTNEAWSNWAFDNITILSKNYWMGTIESNTKGGIVETEEFEEGAEIQKKNGGHANYIASVRYVGEFSEHEYASTEDDEPNFYQLQLWSEGSYSELIYTRYFTIKE